MKIIVLIPTFNPTEKILDVIKNLEDNKISDIVIVNDGSDIEHLKYLKGIKYPIVTHEINMGKGAALKTGFNYIDKNIKKYDGVLTIDDDNTINIDSKFDLIALREICNDTTLNKNFVDKTISLQKDIDLKGITWQSIDKFYGSFNGNNYIISNLNSTTNGLFTTINLENSSYNVEFKDIILKNINIDSLTTWNVGALAGAVKGYTSSNVTHANISNIKVYGNVKGSNNIGGVIGDCNGADVNKVLFNGTVTGNGYGVGGILGQTSYRGKVTASNIYFSGTLKNINGTGGLIVGSSASTVSTITNCVVGKANIETTDNFGIIGGGTSYGSYEITNCYSLDNNYDNNIGILYNSSDRTNLTILSSDNFKNQSSFQTLDFTNVWEIKNNSLTLK